MSDKVNDAGNITSDNVQTAQVDGYEVSVKQLEDGSHEIVVPDDAPDTDEFVEKVKKAQSVMGIINKKGFDVNRKREDLEKKEAELLKRERELQLKAIPKESLPELTELVYQELGIKTEDELDDVTQAELLKAQTKALKTLDEMRKKSTDNQGLIQSFINDGGDYNGLVEFAAMLNAPISKALINQYTKTNGTKRKFSTEELSKIQGQAISVVRRGGAAPGTKMSKAERIFNAGGGPRL
jgi:hypothetical protein